MKVFELCTIAGNDLVAPIGLPLRGDLPQLQYLDNSTEANIKIPIGNKKEKYCFR